MTYTPPPLTPRQTQIVTGLARGRTTTQIARHLGIAPATASTHITQIRDRLAIPTTGDTRAGSIRARIVHTAITRGHLTRPRRKAQAVTLDPHQQRLLAAIAHGHTHAQTSRRLGPRPSTIKAHTAALLKRLGARTRAHAVAIAHRDGHLTTGRDRP